MLSKESYYSSEIFDNESEKLSKSSWWFVCHLNELENNFDFVTSNIFNSNVIVQNYNDEIVGFSSDDFQKHGLLNTLGNLLYFSVVVYSTVGFGEILPIGPLGKTVMVFEGIAGGLVLAILIIALYKKTMDR